MSDRVRVGLVGAGPWAQLFTGPMLAGADAVELVGVWARRPDAAAALAASLSVSAVDELDRLIDGTDAVAFAVPPAVQAELAARAASAGRAVLLDKPIAADLAGAEALAAAVDVAGVASQVILTNRYLAPMRAFLAAAASVPRRYGGRASFFGDGCVPGTYFGTPWRIEEGGLLDLGPHVLDALDAALGPITAIEARGDVHGLVLLTCEHGDGVVSQGALSGTTHQTGGLAVEVHGPDGAVRFDSAAFAPEDAAEEFAAAQRRIVEEFATCVRTGTAHELDVHRGLVLQRLIDEAARQLRERSGSVRQRPA
jgi:predicted dehydrogenase